MIKPMGRSTAANDAQKSHFIQWFGPAYLSACAGSVAWNQETGKADTRAPSVAECVGALVAERGRRRNRKVG